MCIDLGFLKQGYLDLCCLLHTLMIYLIVQLDQWKIVSNYTDDVVILHSTKDLILNQYYKIRWTLGVDGFNLIT